MTEPDLVCQSVFCEFTRQEAEKRVSLIGIFPDQLNVRIEAGEDEQSESSAPAIPSLSIYTRARLPLGQPIKGSINIHLRSPTGQSIFEHSIEDEFVKDAFENAVAEGREHLTLVSQFTAQNFPILEEGRFVVWVQYAGDDYFSGSLRINRLK